MLNLAINGGEKIREKPFPAYNTIGVEEEDAVLRVLRSGKLSTFLGAWHDDFYGGDEVQSLEKEWGEFFNSKHAISVNSATSGLFCAVGACGISPGDEIIVSPYTMSASVTAAIVYGAIPVFADIERDYYCLSIDSIEKNITPKTKAIIAVDIFGQPYNYKEVNALAKKHNLKIIEDAAQAPGVKFDGKYAGTLGDIGIYSLNYHKHIHTGEGGIVVTDDDELAMKVRLIRNHAEAVIGGKGYKDREQLVNMVGFNYRMTEIEASIAREQLRKLPSLIEKRQKNITFLEKYLSEIPCLEMPKIRGGAEHAYYVHPIKFNFEVAGIDRNRFIDAVKAELPGTIMRDDSEVLLSCGYAKPLYQLPMFKEKLAFGSKGYPFNLSNRDYGEIYLPNVEEAHNQTVVTHEFMRPGMTEADMKDVFLAFEKVWNHIGEL